MSRPRHTAQRLVATPDKKRASDELSNEIRLIPISLADEIRPGDSLVEKLLSSLRQHNVALESGDILVVKHKIVSKAQGKQIRGTAKCGVGSAPIGSRREH